MLITSPPLFEHSLHLYHFLSVRLNLFQNSLQADHKTSYYVTAPYSMLLKSNYPYLLPPDHFIPISFGEMVLTPTNTEHIKNPFDGSTIITRCQSYLSKRAQKYLTLTTLKNWRRITSASSKTILAFTVHSVI